MSDDSLTTTNDVDAKLAKITNGKSTKFIRAFIQTMATAISAVPNLAPLACLMSVVSSLWGEHEQEKTNEVFVECMKQANSKIDELSSIVFDALAQHDLEDEAINARVTGPEFQGLIRRAFRDESTYETQFKREHLRKLLSHAAVPGIIPDDLIRIFIGWLAKYDDLHFKIAGIVRNCKGCTRLEIWEGLDGEKVREDSAEADLFANLIADLSLGHVIRQERAKTRDGHFLKSAPRRRTASSLLKSRFADDKGYELTELGSQFIHYVMDEQVKKLSQHGK